MWTIASARLVRVGAKLLAEDPVLAGRYGRVVERDGSERNLVPVPELARRVRPRLEGVRSRHVAARWVVEGWSEYLGGTPREPARPGHAHQGQGEQSQCESRHLPVAFQEHAWSSFSVMPERRVPVERRSGQQ